MSLMQQKIKEAGLTIHDMFEEIPIFIHRNHLVQAFMFEHLNNSVSEFNLNMFNLAQPKFLNSQIFELNSTCEELLLEQQRLEQGNKMIIKQQKKGVKKGGEEVKENDKIDFFMLARQVDEFCDQIASSEIPTENM